MCDYGVCGVFCWLDLWFTGIDVLALRAVLRGVILKGLAVTLCRFVFNVCVCFVLCLCWIGFVDWLERHFYI